MDRFKRLNQAWREKQKRITDQRKIAPVLVDLQANELLARAEYFVDVMWKNTAPAPGQVDPAKRQIRGGDGDRISRACGMMRKAAQELRRTLHFAERSQCYEDLVYCATVMSNVRFRRRSKRQSQHTAVKPLAFERGDEFHTDYLRHLHKAGQILWRFCSEQRAGEYSLKDARDDTCLSIAELSRAAGKSLSDPGYLPTRRIGRERYVRKAVARRFALDFEGRALQRNED